MQSPWGAVARLLHQLSAVKSLLFRCRNASTHIKRKLTGSFSMYFWGERGII